MLKFKIIYNKPDNQSLLSNEINVLQEQNVPLDEREMATILITDSTERETVGSLSLIKRKFDQLGEDISDFIPVAQDEIWEGSHLNGISSPCFYRTLFEGIAEFGGKKGLEFVVVKLTADAYPFTKEIGLWPYVLEFPPRESSDGYFYGVLPLRGAFYEEYMKRWGEFNLTQER